MTSRYGCFIRTVNDFIAKVSKVRVNDLVASCDFPLIVQRQACSYTERFLSYLRASDLPVPRTIEAGSVEALLGLVEQGLGIAVAPRTLANRSSIKIIPLTPLRAKRWVNVYLVSNRIGWNSTAQGFVEHCGKRFIVEQRAAGSPTRKEKEIGR